MSATCPRMSALHLFKMPGTGCCTLENVEWLEPVTDAQYLVEPGQCTWFSDAKASTSVGPPSKASVSRSTLLIRPLIHINTQRRATDCLANAHSYIHRQSGVA